MREVAAVKEQVLARVTASATVVSNFAWQHLRAATLFRDHLKALETSGDPAEDNELVEKARSYASGAIMSAVASLEALVNELFLSPTGLRPKVGNFEQAFWGRQGIESKPILTKYQYSLQLVGAPPFEESDALLQEAAALIALRNSLVHFKPVLEQDGNRAMDLESRLSGRYALAPWYGPGDDFIAKRSMSAGCAGWSVSIVIAFLKEHHRRSLLEPEKMANFWRLEA